MSSILFTIACTAVHVELLYLRDPDLPTRGCGKIGSRDLTFETNYLISSQIMVAMIYKCVNLSGF